MWNGESILGTQEVHVSPSSPFDSILSLSIHLHFLKLLIINL